MEEFNVDRQDLTPSQRCVLDTFKSLAVKKADGKTCETVYDCDRVVCLYTFHGCSVSVVDSILSNGLKALHKLDGGYFGAGVYTTPSLEYACRYAAGEFADSVKPPTGAQVDATSPPPGCYPVVCCASLVSNAYPLTRDSDYPAGSSVSKYYAGPSQPSKALRPGCDAHFVPVSESVDFQAVSPSSTVAADYYELVQNTAAMVVPMGVLWVVATGP